MAELVDALVSGASISNDVQVRLLFWAQQKKTVGDNQALTVSFLPLAQHLHNTAFRGVVRRMLPSVPGGR